MDPNSLTITLRISTKNGKSTWITYHLDTIKRMNRPRHRTKQSSIQWKRDIEKVRENGLKNSTKSYRPTWQLSELPHASPFFPFIYGSEAVLLVEILEKTIKTSGPRPTDWSLNETRVRWNGKSLRNHINPTWSISTISSTIYQKKKEYNQGNSNLGITCWERHYVDILKKLIRESSGIIGKIVLSQINITYKL